MAFVPPNGIFTIPRRGRAFRIDVDIAEELTDAYAYQMVRAIPSASTLLRSTDRFSPYNILRPKRALPDMSPFPDSFTRGHLRALNFSFIKWDKQSGPLVDLRDRIGAMYFGSPVEGLVWERSVIQAGEDMQNARDYLALAGSIGWEHDAISAGFRCFGPAGNRPQNIREHRPVSIEDVVLTGLRNSPAIQTIASFQDDMLKTVAPRAWKSANEIIDAVLTHDPGLHLPFYLPNADPPLRPTAFSRAQYHFTTDGMPRSESGTYFPSLSALTSLGNYHVDEGELILWSERTVVNFPVGATILLPEWMPYSFTSVESPGYQMIFSQTCDQGLCEYVQNDFSGEFAVVEPTTEESRRKILWDARAGASLYGTLNELDSLYAWS